MSDARQRKLMGWLILSFVSAAINMTMIAKRIGVIVADRESPQLRRAVWNRYGNENSDDVAVYLEHNGGSAQRQMSNRDISERKHVDPNGTGNSESVKLKTSIASNIKYPICHRLPSLRKDEFCHGCQRDRCKNEIKGMRRRNTPFTKMSTNCARCHPDACSADQKIYRRLDEAAPRIWESKTHFLKSIPEEYRLPTNLSNSSAQAEYFDIPENSYPSRVYLNEFNPSIVTLPVELLPDELQHQGIAYAASFRVSTQHACVHTMPDIRKFQKPRKPLNLMGLALLDADLSIVAETTVGVRDANRTFRIEDHRLFVLKGLLYVASFTEMIQLSLKEPTKDENAHGREFIRLEPLGGNGNMPSPFSVYAATRSSCPSIRDGKNINYFVDPSSDKIIAELTPLMEKVEVFPGKDCQCSGKGQCKRVNLIPPVNLAKNQSKAPMKSFGTTEELEINVRDVLTPPRGSACCVSIEHQSRELWLGIIHQKTKFKKNGLPGNLKPNSFVSSFYVFEKTSPYSTIARSGSFCFGDRSIDYEGNWINPYRSWDQDRLYLGGDSVMECPKIHFVSGIAQDAVDPDRIIVAYGHSDCTPRLVKVSKSEILRMLFAPQADASKRIESISSATNASRSTPHFDCSLGQAADAIY